MLGTSFNHGKTRLYRQVGKQDMTQTSEDSKYYNDSGGYLFPKAVNLWSMTDLKVTGHFVASWLQTREIDKFLGQVKFRLPIKQS